MLFESLSRISLVYFGMCVKHLCHPRHYTRVRLVETVRFIPLTSNDLVMASNFNIMYVF